MIDIKNFRIPRYHEIPDVGLYLEQTTKYINGYLEPLGCMEITSSMVSNYVKKGYIDNPVKKQYHTDQIVYLFFIAITKNVLSLENICKFLEMQKGLYPLDVAFDYFCEELENVLGYLFGAKETLDNIGRTTSEAKTILRSAIIATAHIIYLDDQFKSKSVSDITTQPVIGLEKFQK